MSMIRSIILGFVFSIISVTAALADSRFTPNFDRVWPIGYIKAQNQFESDIAKDTLNGGYIFVVRHAHREKWIDVTMYDALEAITQGAEDSYYEKAVCLSERGKVQAKVMGELIKHIELPIGELISSLSCRARQTASLTFGRQPDKLYGRLLHYYGDPYGPFEEDRANHYVNVKKILLNHAPKGKFNTIISAHNNTIVNDMLDGVVENGHTKVSEIDTTLEEGGFHLLKVVDGKLLWVAKYHNFQGYINKFLKRPN